MFIDNKYLPSTKEETWKYTNISSIYNKYNIKKILKELDLLISKENIRNFKFNQKNTILIIDGFLEIDYNNKLSNVDISKLSKDNRSMSKLAKENSRKFGIKINKNTKNYLKIIFINTTIAKNKLVNSSLKIDVDMFSTLDLDVNFINLTETSAINVFLDIHIAENSKINYTNNSFNKENNLITTANYLINLDKNAEFNGFSLISRNTFLRNDFIVNLNKSYSKFNIKGAYLLDNNEISNTYFLVNHNASNTYSNVNFHGIVNGSSKACFNAKAIVNKGIKQIRAYQNNKNIQLNNKAEINTKPELEIFSDDIICTHGATIGQLDEDALFYLQSRGIELKDAKHLLLESFIKSQILNYDFSFKKEIKDQIMKSINLILNNYIKN